MIHEEYFKKRFSDIYDLSVIKYMNGQGFIEYDEVKLEVEWNLNISVEGKITLVLSIPGFFDCSNSNQKVKMNGKTDDSVWKINCYKVKIGDIQHHCDSIIYTTVFCSLLDKSLYIEKNNSDEYDIDKIEGYLMNFDNYRNFEVEIKNREVIFEQINNRNEINKHIKSKRIDKAIFSKLTFPVIEKELDKSKLLLNNLCSLVSLINMNYNFCTLINYYSDGEIVKKEINHNISMTFHRNVIIDNYEIRNGLKYFLEGFYEGFVRLNQEINMDKFISLFSEIQSGNFIIEKKLAELIMAYEYLITRYLLNFVNVDIDEDASIQTKIGCLNTYLRFIPSDLDGDDLRSEIRNNLFHIGHIPQMSFEEKDNAFDNYFDLLIRIILKMIGYTGKYLSRPNFKPKNVI